jgi:hypothetical protein
MKNAKQFETILKLSADNRETLRAFDVDRVHDAINIKQVWLLSLARGS